MTNKQIISFFYLINKHQDISSKIGDDKANLVCLFLIEILKSSTTLIIDLKEINSISPSFSYIAFGKLVDEFGESVMERLEFTNDNLNLKKIILRSIDRRKKILDAEKSYEKIKS